MMKIVRISVFLFISITANAQTWNWVKIEPGANDPYPNHQMHIIAADDSGNVYFTGNYYAGVTLDKYDKFGNLVWHKVPSVTSDLNYSHSVILSSGNEYITGEFITSLVFGKDTLVQGGATKMFLAKYNTGGIVLWAIQSEGTAKTNGESDATDANGNVFVGGNFLGELIFGKDTFNYGNSNENVYLVKYDKNGSYRWSKAGISQNIGANSLYSVASDSMGDAFISGFYTSSLVFGMDTLPKVAGNQSTAFVVKYDSNGNLIWFWTPRTGTCASEAFCVTADKEGNAYFCGEFNSGNLITGSDTLFQYPGVYNPFFIKIHPYGNIAWVKQCVNLIADNWSGESISIDSSDNLYMLLTGNGFSTYKIVIGKDTFQNTGYGTADIIVALDSAGNEKCGSIFTEGLEDDGDGMNIIPAGKYIYVAGDIYGNGIFGNDTVIGDDSSFFIASWQPCNSIIETTPNLIQTTNAVSVFPNPSSGSFTLSLSNVNEKCQVEIYDVLGEKVTVATLKQVQGDNSLNLSEQPNGIYFYRVLDENGGVLGSGKLIIQK